MLDWGKLLEESFQEWQQQNAGQHTGKKRAAPAAASSTTKKVKASEADGDSRGTTDADMKKRYKQGAIGKLTVPELKSYIGEKRLGSVAGLKKADLVSLVEEHFENKMDVD